MTERPIIFSGPMVTAILDGRKTQTRRIVKLPLKDRDFGCELAGNEIGQTEAYRHSPYGRPGDRLWVRESFAKRQDCDDDTDKARHYLMFKADGGDPRDSANWHDYGSKWYPSIHMPRWASRITLEVTGALVERLQEISEADAVAEGIVRCQNGTFDGGGPAMGPTATHAYMRLWDSINAKRAPWASNPWVWVVEFRRRNG